MSSWKQVFAILWTGQLFSTLSSAVVGYAVVFWLSIETGSAEVLAVSTIASLLPQLVLGLFTGVLIDRWDRKRIMVAADLFIAVCSAIMALLFFFGQVKLLHLYSLLALRSIGSAFHVPAMQASVPLLAPETELLRVAGINQVIQSISTIAGPALAAVLISKLNMTYVLLFDVIGAAIGCISLLLIHIPNPAKPAVAQAPDLLNEMKQGLREITRNAGLLWLFIFMIVANFFLMPVSVLFPLMTLNHFSGGTYEMSAVEIAWGLGMLLGGALLGIFKPKISNVIQINAMYVLLGLTFLFSGVLTSDGFPVFVFLTFLAGISGAVFFSAFTVVLQTLVNPAALGRVFSIHGSITLLPAMIGLLQTGFIADSIGITNAFIIAGAIIGLVGVISFFIPAIRRLVAQERATARENALARPCA